MRRKAAARDLAGPATSTAIESSAGGGRLFVVATPIGNLGDVTYRAIETLGSVSLIAAEDTRHTSRLLARYEIRTRLISYHARSGSGRRDELLEHLRSGLDLALVTDAGTPLVSDPGGELAAAWAAEGGAIVPIPGASAALAALVASGLAVAHWTFEGFLPRSGAERRARLARIGADERACVIYEAPSRVPATLSDLAAAAGPERRVAICRELTKIHEEVVRGQLGELVERAIAGGMTLRGEFAIVIEAVPAGGRRRRGDGMTASRTVGGAEPVAAARAEVERLVAEGLRRPEAVRRAAAASGVDRRTLYRPGGGSSAAP